MSHIRNATFVALLLALTTSSFSQEGTTESTASTSPPGISIAGQPLERVLGTLNSKLTSATVIARGKTIGVPVSVVTREADLEKILEIIVTQKPNWLWHKSLDKPDTYEIWDQESYRAEVLPKLTQQRIIVPKNITAEEAYKAITRILTPSIGSAAFDPRSNKIIINDLPDVLEKSKRLVEQIDIKFITRVYYLRHADPAKMAEHLSHLKSPAAPIALVDERTRQIVVFDRMDILRQMDLIVQTFDIPAPKTDRDRAYERDGTSKKPRRKRDLGPANAEKTSPI
jgi:type II secretory pathway component GspD/PulD (secretin)